MFRGVEIKGLPMMRSLVIDGTIIYPTIVGNKLTAKIGNIIAFSDSAFVDPLDQVASAIRNFHEAQTRGNCYQACMIDMSIAHLDSKS